MKIIKPSFEILTEIDATDMLKKIEIAGRTCYKSEKKITSRSARSFVKNIISRGHESVIEHVSITVRIICDRGVSHEIVRHRLASYSQESTRYCHYKEHVVFIKPCFLINVPEGIFTPISCNESIRLMSAKEDTWFKAMLNSEHRYHCLLAEGCSAQEARSVLPNSLKTEIICTMNLREWRHFFRQRTSPAAHPQMREIAIPLLKKFKSLLPVIFDDITVNE